MLSAKENLLMCLRGEQPEYVPVGAMQDGDPPPSMMVAPPLLHPERDPEVRRNLFGVRFVHTDSTGGAGMPANDEFVLPLDGIKNWGDYVKIPDFSDVVWEPLIAEQLKNMNYNRADTALVMDIHMGYFQLLMSIMGFEAGMIALYEYPDEVKELLDAISEFYIGVAKRTIDIYDPEALTLCDDTAAWYAPFISPDTFREFFMPHHDKYAKIGRDRGLLIQIHCCGKTEDFIPLYLEMGIHGWSAAQTCNDLLAVKAKYGNDMVFMGGWDGRERLLDPMASPENPGGLTEEELRQSVRDAMDKYAPGGGYTFGGGFMVAVGDEETPKKNVIIRDEARKYSLGFYK
ncbi:MAG: veratrol--corrinoid protein metyltransferase [Coriobacteriia bacterium]|nr:veratrol--corrinoid protein metyltransferase [Coriobacteriia bacterium]